MVGCDLFIATAIGTKRLAKGQMNIKAYAISLIGAIKAFFKDIQPIFSIKVVMPVWNSRIACITRNSNIVFVQEFS